MNKLKFFMHFVLSLNICFFLIYQGYVAKEVVLIIGNILEEIRKTYYHIFREYEVRTR